MGKLKFIISNATVGFQKISWWIIATCILLFSGDRTNVILESFKIITNIFYSYKLCQRFSSIFFKQHCCGVGWKQKELFENFCNEIISSIYAHITEKIFICVHIYVWISLYVCIGEVQTIMIFHSNYRNYISNYCYH